MGSEWLWNIWSYGGSVDRHSQGGSSSKSGSCTVRSAAGEKQKNKDKTELLEQADTMLAAHGVAARQGGRGAWMRAGQWGRRLDCNLQCARGLKLRGALVECMRADGWQCELQRP